VVKRIAVIKFEVKDGGVE